MTLSLSCKAIRLVERCNWNCVKWNEIKRSNIRNKRSCWRRQMWQRTMKWTNLPRFVRFFVCFFSIIGCIRVRKTGLVWRHCQYFRTWTDSRHSRCRNVPASTKNKTNDRIEKNNKHKSNRKCTRKWLGKVNNESGFQIEIPLRIKADDSNTLFEIESTNSAWRDSNAAIRTLWPPSRSTRPISRYNLILRRCFLCVCICSSNKVRSFSCLFLCMCVLACTKFQGQFGYLDSAMLCTFAFNV